MNYLDQLLNHTLVQKIMEDGNQVFKNRKIDITGINFEPNPPFNELEYYIHSLGFSIVHFLNLCKQLNLSIELLTNYSYKNNNISKRGEHLVYNIENYIIRFLSINDRLLQLINNCFHLLMHESYVNTNVILKNYKISRTKIPAKFKPIRKYLNDFQESRNIIVHRHSYQEPELRKIELIYSANYDDMAPKLKKEMKIARANYLSNYIIKKKKEYTKSNSDLFKLLIPLFDSLEVIYLQEKNRLNKII